MGWLIAITQKNAAFHAAQYVSRLVVPIGTMTNSVRGWILTGFAKARLACAIGVNVGMRMTNGIVNGIGGREMEFERINKICPVCGSGNFMMLMKGENVCKRNVKCINCNHYFIYDALRNKDGQTINKELRLCPFCGGNASIVQVNTSYGGRPVTIQNGYKVGCGSCKIYTPVFDSAVWVDEKGGVHADKNGAEDAATLWNRRVNNA